MNKYPKNPGFTVVELLGTVALFGLLIGLVSVFLAVYQSGFNSIFQSGRINAQSTYITRIIENELRSITIDHIDFCEGSELCILAEQNYDYTVDLETYSIDVSLRSSPIIRKIEISNGYLIINDEDRMVGSIPLGEDSTIEIIRRTSDTTIIFTIILDLSPKDPRTVKVVYTYNHP